MRVLVLVHHSCVPPKQANRKAAEWADWKTEFYVQKTLKQLGHDVYVHGVSGDLSELKREIDDFRPNVVFNLLEEYQGEPEFEAHVVSFLELLGVPYTGCNPHGLAIGRDKALSKKILNYHGILTPGFFTVEEGRSPKVPSALAFPMIVKSLNEEASLGISQDSIVNNQEKLKARVRFIHEQLQTPALVEEYISGRELYVGIVGNRSPQVFKPWELRFGKLVNEGHPIATRTVKFNKKYCEKYEISRGLAQGLSPFLQQKIKNTSFDIFKALKLSGYGRLDYRVTDQGELYFLEANPNAELANGECLANAAHHTGLNYPQLIHKILHLALKYRRAA